MNLDTTLNHLRRLERAEESAAGEREGANAIAKAAEAEGHIAAAMRLALRIDKMKPGKKAAFLRSFDTCREALGLDAQIDLEDAITENSRDTVARTPYNPVAAQAAG